MAKTYLITGARGIGEGLIEAALASDKDAKVIVGVRNTQSASVKKFTARANVIVVHIDSLDEHSAAQAAKELKESAGVDTIDVIIANAGDSPATAPLVDLTPQQLRWTLDVNLIGPMTLFQAFKPFLRRSHKCPTFAVTSSTAGSLTLAPHIPFTYAAYAISKTAVNMLAVQMAKEETWLNVLLIHPGFTNTSGAARNVGDASIMNGFVEQGFTLTPMESGKRMVDYISSFDRQTNSGHFYDVQKSEEVPW